MLATIHEANLILNDVRFRFHWGDSANTVGVTVTAYDLSGEIENAETLPVHRARELWVELQGYGWKKV